MPDDYRRWGEEWLSLHPGWRMLTWNDEDVERWIQMSDWGEFRGANFQTRRLYEQFTVMAQKVDLLAVEIPYAFGGIYLDSDFEPAKNIEPLLDEVRAFAAREVPHIIAGGIMGCVPGHPAFRDIIAGIPESVRNGVGVGTQHFQRWEGKEDTVIFTSEQMYPFYMGEDGTNWKERFPQAYAAHHWGHSWAGAVSPEVTG